MKFRTDVTKGGYKILSIHGPDGCEEYAGVVDTGGSYLTITWYDTGIPVSANDLYSLVPINEPKPDDKIKARLEAFEGRLEALEHDNKESDTWGVRVNEDLHELHNRILKLEQKTTDTSDYYNLRLQVQDLKKRLGALETAKAVDDWLLDNSGLMDKLAKLEESTKSTQPNDVSSGVIAATPSTTTKALGEVTPTPGLAYSQSKAGLTRVAWVTKKMLEEAMLDFSRETIGIVAKRLGLEE